MVDDPRLQPVRDGAQEFCRLHHVVVLRIDT